MSVAQQIAEAVRSLPEKQAREVLGFVQALQHRKDVRRADALEILQRHRGRFTVESVTPLDRAELHERSPLR